MGPIAGAVSSATDLSRTDVRCLRALLTCIVSIPHAGCLPAFV